MKGMKKRWLSMLMAWIMIFSVMPTTVLAADTSGWDGISVSQPVQDENKVYQIGTAEELAWYAGLVNGTLDRIAQNKGALATLTADIDLNGKAWTPIGNSTQNTYTGSFDGAKHTISGLKFSAEATYGGFFGNVAGKNACIKDLTVKGSVAATKNYNGGIAGKLTQSAKIENCISYVKITSSGDAKYIGGIAGYLNKATVSDCINYGDMEGSATYVGGIAGQITYTATISNCMNEGMIRTTSGEYIGGIAGHINAKKDTQICTIKSCCNSGMVISDSKYVGGIAGTVATAYGEITDCYNLGTVVGTGGYAAGIAGSNAGTVTNCYTAGTLKLVGEKIGNIAGDSTGTAANCYYLADALTALDGNGTAKSDSEMKSADFVTALGASFKSGCTYPILFWQTDGTHTYDETTGQCTKEACASKATHVWNDATCTTPMTCTICKETRGSKLGHVYADGVCVICGGKETEASEPAEKAAPTAITLPESMSMFVGAMVTLTPVVVPEDADSDVTWESSDSSIATVDAQGGVIGRSAGKVTITATSKKDASIHAQTIFIVAEASKFTADWAGVFNNRYDNNNVSSEKLPTDAKKISESWTAEVGNSTIVIVGDYIYTYACSQGMGGFQLAGTSQTFYKIEKETGTIVRTTSNCPGKGSYYYGYTIYGGKYIYVSCPNALMAFDPDTCEMIWSNTDKNLGNYCCAQYVNGCVVVNGKVFDGNTGEFKKNLEGDYSYSNGATHEDSFYIADYNGTLYVFNTTTWEKEDSISFKTDNIAIQPGVLYHNGKLYWGDAIKNNIYSVELDADGRLKKDTLTTTVCGYTTTCTPVAYGDRVYLAGQSGQQGVVGVFAADDLHVIYKTPISNSLYKIQSTPILYADTATNTVYLWMQVYNKSTIYYLADTPSTTSGSLKELVTPSLTQYAWEQIACDKDGALYVTNDSGVLFKFVDADKIIKTDPEEIPSGDSNNNGSTNGTDSSNGGTGAPNGTGNTSGSFASTGDVAPIELMVFLALISLGMGLCLIHRRKEN